MKDDYVIKDFVERSQDRLGSLEADLLDLEVDPSVVIHPLLRSAVSIYEEAEMIGVKHIEEITYCLVKCLKAIRDHPLQPDTELVTLLLKLFDSLEYALKEIGCSWDLRDLDNHMIVQVRSIVQTLEAHIAVLTNPTELFSEIEQIFPLRSAAHLAALDYGKQVEVEILDGQVRIPWLLLKRLPRLLTHLLNNAIAHGIEMPEVRQSLGKPVAGKIILAAAHKDGQVVISFSDDGAGIDVERVKAKAIMKKLITDDDTIRLSDVEIYEFLFHPDFSTKDIRDMRAGTGYGLDIVRSELKKIGGSVRVCSTLGQGTTFIITYVP